MELIFSYDSGRSYYKHTKEKLTITEKSIEWSAEHFEQNKVISHKHIIIEKDISKESIRNCAFPYSKAGETIFDCPAVVVTFKNKEESFVSFFGIVPKVIDDKLGEVENPFLERRNYIYKTFLSGTDITPLFLSKNDDELSEIIKGFEIDTTGKDANFGYFLK